MTRKSKKLGVKTSKSTVFDEVEEVIEENKDAQETETPNTNGQTDEEYNKICLIIDKLTLDMLILMQQNIQQKLKIEKRMTEGELHLSKSRYIMGHKSVSSLQIPNETSDEINPSITLEESNDSAHFGSPKLEIIEHEFSKDNGKNIPDPVKWFGVLVPRDLRNAQSKFKDVIENVVECANLQIRLHQTCVKLRQMKILKDELKKNIQN